MCKGTMTVDIPSSHQTHHLQPEMKGSHGPPTAPKWRGLDTLSPPLQFAVLACGVVFFFGTHNVLQEAMVKIPGFQYGVMLGYMEVLG